MSTVINCTRSFRHSFPIINSHASIIATAFYRVSGNPIRKLKAVPSVATVENWMLWIFKTPRPVVELSHSLRIWRKTLEKLRNIIGTGLDLIPKPKWRNRKDPWQPNKWKWYHRHGYWATRKKLLKFDKYRPYRYHEVRGYGVPKKAWWQSNSYYRPLTGSIRFW